MGYRQCHHDLNRVPGDDLSLRMANWKMMFLSDELQDCWFYHVLSIQNLFLYKASGNLRLCKLENHHLWSTIDHRTKWTMASRWLLDYWRISPLFVGYSISHYIPKVEIRICSRFSQPKLPGVSSEAVFVLMEGGDHDSNVRDWHPASLCQGEDGVISSQIFSKWHVIYLIWYIWYIYIYSIQSIYTNDI